MQLVNSVCSSLDTTRPFLNSIMMWFALTPLLFGFLATFIAAQITKKPWHKILVIIFGGIPIILVSAVLSIISAYLIHNKIYPNSQAMRFFQLNAAVKNTCYLDPKMINCPTNLKELINIQRQDFLIYLDQAHLTYSYYPDTNEYTLIARYDKGRAVIFDPRLKSVTKTGYDFEEYYVSRCGTDHIVNPPDFPGPWDQVGSGAKTSPEELK